MISKHKIIAFLTYNLEWAVCIFHSTQTLHFCKVLVYSPHKTHLCCFRFSYSLFFSPVLAYLISIFQILVANVIDGLYQILSVSCLTLVATIDLTSGQQCDLYTGSIFVPPSFWPLYGVYTLETEQNAMDINKFWISGIFDLLLCPWQIQRSQCIDKQLLRKLLPAYALSLVHKGMFSFTRRLVICYYG